MPLSIELLKTEAKPGFRGGRIEARLLKQEQILMRARPIGKISGEVTDQARLLGRLR